MYTGKPKTLINGIISVAVLVSLTVGCSENPTNTAAEELRRATRSALDLVKTSGDYEKARKDLKTALTRHCQNAGPACQAAVLAAGNLAVSHAQQMQLDLSDLADEICATADDISLSVTNISFLQTRKEQLANFIDATSAEITALEKILNEGDDQRPGRGEQLASADARLRELQQEKSRFERLGSSAQGYAYEIQQKADEKFRLAETVSGDKKAGLQQEGYELLLTRKDHDIRAQEMADKVKVLQSQIATIEPLAIKLRADVDELDSQIDNIVNSPRRTDLTDQLNEVQKQIDSRGSRITALISELKKLHTDHNQTVDNIMSAFSQAGQYYEQAQSKSPNGREMVAVHTADSHFSLAAAASDNVRFQKNLSLRLKSMASAIRGTIADSLNKVAQLCEGIGSEAGTKAMSEFDLCLDTYDKMSKSAKGKGDFAASVIKKHILALYGKMDLADNLGQYDTVDDLLGAMDELMEKVRKYDPAFYKSIDDSLFSGTTNYIPELPVDKTAYYEGIKKQLQGYKKVRGTDREAEVLRLLDVLEELKSSMGLEEYKSMFSASEKELKDALAKGFEFEEETQAETTDPNYR